MLNQEQELISFNQMRFRVSKPLAHGLKELRPYSLEADMKRLCVQQCPISCTLFNKLHCAVLHIINTRTHSRSLWQN